MVISHLITIIIVVKCDESTTWHVDETWLMHTVDLEYWATDHHCAIYPKVALRDIVTGERIDGM